MDLAGAGDGDRTRDVQLGNSLFIIDFIEFAALAGHIISYNLVNICPKRNPGATRNMGATLLNAYSGAL
jgi:hypothetical protein